MMKKSLCGIIMIMSAFPPSVSVGDDGGMYVNPSITYSRTNKFKMNSHDPMKLEDQIKDQDFQYLLDKASGSSKFGFGFVVGYKFSDCNMRLGLYFDHVHNSFKRVSIIQQGIIPSGSDYPPRGDASLKISTTAVLLNGVWDILVDNQYGLSPYISFGAGIANHDSKDYKVTVTTVNVTNQNYDSKTDVFPHNKSKNRFAWNLGAGLQFPITEKLKLDFGIKYFDYGNTAKTGQEYVPSTATTPGTKLRGIMSNVGVAYYF